MIGFVKGIFSGATFKWLAILALVSMLGAGGLYVKNYVEDKNQLALEVQAQRIEISVLESTLATKELLIATTEHALEVATEELKASEKRAVDFARERDKLLSTPEEDDGVVAPVLNDALDVLRNR